MTCEFAQFDGSYVLGALSAAERQEFEQHLTHCGACAESVRQLAGMPGLLAHVDPELLDEQHQEPLPGTLLPNLIAEVRRTRRRRTFVTAGAAAAAAAAVVVGSLALTDIADDADRRPPTAAPTSQPATESTPADPGLEMEPVGQVPVRASLAFERVAWGTRLSLTCSYDAPGGRYPPAAQRYALVISTADGRERQVATWRAVPGRTMQLEASTALGVDEISSVEVHTTTGRAVLRLDT